ncbi:hypothetical protein [Halomicronema sp. CCY15110]|uniref:hypothetical protein n=1 Tax=Halomicronema sp. CCY15110 TaxID=2767773 RepID=UPI0019506044|nr:hypothetical protein [Halomicronema sp. CCY15110]
MSSNILPRYGRPSSGGGEGSFGGFGGGYGGGGSGFSPWIGLNYGSLGSSGPSNPGDPTPPPEEGIYIQSIDGNGFRVIYGRVDLAGDTFVHKPKTIETAFGNVNFFYHDQADSALGVAKGDFSYTDDPEVFEVLLAAVGAQSVDDLSDIFVTGPFTQSEALAKEEAERVKTISDLWSRLGYIGILPNLGIQDLNLTPEKRKQLLDFEENLLKATALTDEFQGFGREEDALLLGEMTQLARVYAALDPQLEENIGDSSGGSSSPPPVEDIDVLLVSQYRLTPGEQLMVDRLSADGFNVTSKWSGHFQKSDVEDQELVIITGNIFSSDSVLDDLAVPIISLQTIMLDELDIRPVGSNGGNSAVSGRGDTITISSPDHPLAGGFSGDVEIFNPDSNGSVHILRPTEDAVEIATFSSSSGMESSPILGYEKGANLLNGEIAPERRVAFIPYFQFEKFNENGWQLFDAAVDWAAGLEEEEKDPKQFQSTTVLDFFTNTIWKAGNLEQSTINEFKEEFTDFSEVAIDSTIGVDYLGKLFFVLNETDATKETIQNNFAINEFFVEGTSFTSSVIRGKEAEVNGDELFLEILKAGSDSELSQIAEDINTLINNSLLLASEDNFLSNFHQQINDLSDTIEIPDDAVDWNLLGLVRWQLGID